MADFETTEPEAITLVRVQAVGEEDGAERTGTATRRLVLNSYPAGWHASRAAHPSQRLSRN